MNPDLLEVACQVEDALEPVYSANGRVARIIELYQMGIITDGALKNLLDLPEIPDAL